MTAARTQRSRGLVGNSFALLATTHITALLGYAFWTVCARVSSPSVIGITNTAISAMTLISVIAISGFIPMLTRLLPGASPEERSGLCSTAFVVATLVPGIAGTIGALFMPDRLRAVVGTPWLMVLLGTGTATTALLLVVNAALLGVRRADLSMYSNIVGSIARLGAVATMLVLGVLAVSMDAKASHTILIVWIVSLFISIVLSMWLLIRTAPGFRFHAHWVWFSRMRDSLGWDHVTTLAIRAPPLAIPILAASMFPPAQVGYLAVVGMVVSAFLAVAASISSALLADCADDPRRLQEQARRATRLICMLLVVPVMVTCLLAKEVLSFFGTEYATYSPLLILLLICTFPDALINVAVAVLRVQHRLAVITTLAVIGTIMSIGGSWVLMPHMGLYGIGVALLVSQGLSAIVFAVIVLWPHRLRSSAANGEARTEQSKPKMIGTGLA